VLLPWNAAALPEIMAEAVQDGKLDVSVPGRFTKAKQQASNWETLPEILAGDLPESKRGVLGSGQTGEQQASNRAAPPEREGVERRNPAKA